MGSKDQFGLQVLLKDAPVSQYGNGNVSITCTSAWGTFLSKIMLIRFKEDNLYAGTSEGEILHFFLDRQGATENVLFNMRTANGRLLLGIYLLPVNQLPSVPL
jgi:hypothetical protein